MSWRAAIVVAVVAVLAARGTTAQHDAAGDDAPARFVAAYDAFVAAGTADRARAAALASDRFLALPPGPAHDRHRVAGIHATAAAGRDALAIELAEQARAAGGVEPLLVQSHLQALVRTGRFDRFVATARADLAHARATVHTVLAEHEAALLPLAERALRHGDTAAGRFVFDELAAIAPVQPWRLANQALMLRQLGDAAGARRVYTQALALAPDDVELWNDHGLLLRASGDVAGAAAAFDRAWAIDLARPDALRARGPAITNLVHLAATRPGAVADPLPHAAIALQVRPDATMLKRLVLDVALDRLEHGRAGGR